MSTASAGAHVTGDLGQRLGQLLEEVWARGWEPADLHRAVARDGDAITTQLLGDLMAANLAGYARATVEDRWFAQLEEIGASVWWPAHQGPVAARAGRAKGGWPAIQRAGTQLELTLAILPALERLSSRPGEAAPHRDHGAEVDQRVLSRVRLMLAKAESTTFPAEAETFTAAAQKLMARHSIDRAVLEREAGGSDGPTAIRVGVDRPYESARFHLLSAIARANRCKALWQQGLGFSTVVGFPTDLRAVELLFTSLIVQATAAMTAQGSRAHWSGQSRTRTFRRSFLTAFALRIGERLDSVAREAEAESEQERGAAASVTAGAARAPGAPGSRGADRAALVRVLAERKEEVEAAVAERFPRLKTTRSQAKIDAEGWVSGTTAADRADLGAPGRLGRTGS